MHGGPFLAHWGAAGIVSGWQYERCLGTVDSAVVICGFSPTAIGLQDSVLITTISWQFGLALDKSHQTRQDRHVQAQCIPKYLLTTEVIKNKVEEADPVVRR